MRKCLETDGKHKRTIQIMIGDLYMKCYVCQRNKRIAGIYIGGKAVCEECLELAERYRDLCSAMAKRLELSIEKNQGNKAYKCIHCSNFHCYMPDKKYQS